MAIKVDLEKEDIAVICNGLMLARASALRLSNRQGQVPDAVAAYRREYDKISGLLMRLQHGGK